MRIGMQLKIARVEAELTMAELAKKSDVAISTICEAEKGRKSPRATTVEALCEALGYDLMIVKQSL